MCLVKNFQYLTGGVGNELFILTNERSTILKSLDVENEEYVSVSNDEFVVFFPITEIVLDILVRLEVSEVGNGLLSADETVVVDGRHAQQLGASPAVADRLAAAATGSAAGD